MDCAHKGGLIVKHQFAFVPAASILLERRRGRRQGRVERVTNVRASRTRLEKLAKFKFSGGEQAGGGFIISGGRYSTRNLFWGRLS